MTCGKCRYYIDAKCQDPADHVDENGEEICRFNDRAIPRKDYQINKFREWLDQCGSLIGINEVKDKLKELEL